MGPPSVTPELVEAELRLAGGRKVIGGIEVVVAQELPQVAVPLVGSGLGGDIQYGCSRVPKFGRVVARLHRELAQRVGRRQKRILSLVDQVADIGVVIQAVQQIVVFGAVKAVGTEGAAGLQTACIVLRKRNPRRELRQKMSRCAD